MPLHIAATACNETWAIDHSRLASMLSEARVGSPQRTARVPKIDGDVALLPMHGVISQRGSLWQELFGGTATQSFGAAYTRAVNDDAVKAIVFDVDSPGGTVSGVQELADIIHTGSQLKPTYAVANSQAASAAYWLASQVGPGKFFAAPGSEVGSVGVFRLHEDISGMLEQDGVKVTLIATPQYKTEANPYEPLSDEAREFHLAQVQATYEQFVKDVARGRGTTKARVEADYGKGRALNATDATANGMVDGVLTLGNLLGKFGGKAKATTTASAESQELLLAAWETGFPVVMVVKPRLTTSESRRRRRISVDR